MTFTAVEAMAKAHEAEFRLWTCGHYEDSGIHAVWRDGDEIAKGGPEEAMIAIRDKIRSAASMRAALAALAEVELSEKALNAAGSINDHATRQEFKAIIRALKEERQ